MLVEAEYVYSLLHFNAVHLSTQCMHDQSGDYAFGNQGALCALVNVCVSKHLHLHVHVHVCVSVCACRSP